jgi:hypothetical protein
MHGGNMHIELWLVNPMAKGHLAGQGIYGRIILKFSLEK